MNVPSCQRLSLWRTNSLVCSAFQRNTAASSDHQAFQLSGKKESSWVYFEKNSSAEGSSTWPVWKTTSETEFSPSVALISSLTICSESLHFNITIHKKSKIKTKKWSPHTPKESRQARMSCAGWKLLCPPLNCWNVHILDRISSLFLQRQIRTAIGACHLLKPLYNQTT